MKIIVCTIVLIIQSSILHGQISEVEKCGLDDKAEISIFEAKYFNEVFDDIKGDFNFLDKMIAFYTGSTGNTISSKSNYFNGLKNSDYSDKDVHKWQAGGTQLLVLTKEEKELSGGYDVILISWSKLLKVGKARTKLVKKLK